MNKLTLAPAEIIALKQAHRACKDRRAADRIKAVYSLGMGFSVYEKFDTFKQTTLGFFENIQQYKTELDSLLTNNFQVLNAR